MNLVNISSAVDSRRNVCFLLMWCLLSFSVPVQSLAENRTFKGEGGDLSNAELWEAGGAQGVVTSIVDNIGTYYASDNLNFSVLSVNAKDVTFDFSQTPLRKVLFDGSVTEALTFHPTKSRTFFKGGEWAVAENKTCNFYCGAGSGSKTHDHEVFLDNCVWTNLNRVYVGYSEARCKLTLDNNSCIYANQFFLMNKRQPGCELNIIGGSRMYLSDSANPFYSDNGDGATSGRISISGEGTIASAPEGIFQIGNNSADHTMVLSNKASLVVGSLYVGRETNADRAKVLVADEASLSANEVYVRSAGGNMTVSNATMTVASIFNVGFAKKTGGKFVLSGENTEFNHSPTGWIDVFAEGSGYAEFIVENRAEWNMANNPRFCVKSSNSVFKVASGGAVRIGADGNGTFEFGPGSSTNAPANSISNRIEVCNGGVLGFGGLRLSGNGNAFIVSNATVNLQTRSEDNVMHIGYRYHKWVGVSSTNCSLIIRGKTPKINALDTQLSLMNGSALRFEIPEDGYEKGFIPLCVKHLGCDGMSGTRIEIDCEDFAAKTGGKLILATVKNSGGLTSADTVAKLEAVKQTLPPGSVLTWSDRQLVLKCPRRRFVFSIR